MYVSPTLQRGENVHNHSPESRRDGASGANFAWLCPGAIVCADLVAVFHRFRFIFALHSPNTNPAYYASRFVVTRNQAS